jgi:hypothetical protein
MDDKSIDRSVRIIGNPVPGPQQHAGNQANKQHRQIRHDTAPLRFLFGSRQETCPCL